MIPKFNKEKEFTDQLIAFEIVQKYILPGLPIQQIKGSMNTKNCINFLAEDKSTVQAIGFGYSFRPEYRQFPIRLGKPVGRECTWEKLTALYLDNGFMPNLMVQGVFKRNSWDLAACAMVDTRVIIRFMLEHRSLCSEKPNRDPNDNWIIFSPDWYTLMDKFHMDLIVFDTEKHQETKHHSFF